MRHHVIELDIRCRSCKGTGIYVGVAERDGSGVVCRTCNGLGHHNHRFEYDDFEGRVPRMDVERVLEVNPGICVGKGKHGQYSLADFGGMPYSDWAEGRPFVAGMEARHFTCPAWWYQTSDYERKPAWRECPGFGSFSDCPNFASKGLCWMKWDREQAEVRE